MTTNNTKTKREGQALADYLDKCNQLTDVFYKVVNKNKLKGFTSDQVYDRALKDGIDLTVVRSRLPNLFLTFQKNGIIRKVGTFRLSSRNDSKPLPVWISTATESAPTETTSLGVVPAKASTRSVFKSAKQEI